jgi:hypothetical protein
MAIKPADAAAKGEAKTVQVVIHPRRSAVYQVQTGTKVDDKGKSVPVLAHKTAVGGERIEVSIEDAAYMRAHGFLLEENVTEPPVSAGQSTSTWGEEPRPTINGDDGSVVRAG